METDVTTFNEPMDFIEDYSELSLAQEEYESTLDLTERYFKIVQDERTSLSVENASPSYVLITNEHAHNILSLLGMEEDVITRITTEQASTTPGTFARIGLEEKESLFKKTMDFIYRTFMKLWMVVKKATAKAIVMVANLDKRYDAINKKYISKKPVLINQANGKNISKDEEEKLMKRMQLYFMAFGKITDNTSDIGNLENYIKMVSEAPDFATQTYQEFVEGTRRFIEVLGADVRESDNTNVFLSLAKVMVNTLDSEFANLLSGMSTTYQNRLTKLGLDPKKYGSDDATSLAFFTKISGTVIRYVEKKVIGVFINDDGNITREEFFMNELENNAHYKNKDLVYVGIDLEVKTKVYTFKDDLRKMFNGKFDTTNKLGSGPRIVILDYPTIFKLLGFVKYLSDGFDQFAKEAMRPGEELESHLKRYTESSLNIMKMLQTLTDKDDPYKKVADMALVEHRRTMNSVTKVYPGLSLDLIVGYISMYNDLLAIINFMLDKYEDNV